MRNAWVVRKEEVVHRPLVRDAGRLIVTMVYLSAVGVRPGHRTVFMVLGGGRHREP